MQFVPHTMRQSGGLASHPLNQRTSAGDRGARLVSNVVKMKPCISTPNLKILLCQKATSPGQSRGKAGGEPADRNVRLSRRVDLLTRLMLHAIGRLSMNARARDWFCAILLAHTTYPPRARINELTNVLKLRGMRR